jgi:transposase
MSEDQPRRKPTARRYSTAEKAQAVRLVRQLRAELGTDHGTVQCIAGQLGYGVESVRNWVHQADIEQENRELKRANSILKSASAFFAAELDRPHR